MESRDVFLELFNVNVNDHVEEKNTGKAVLKYLSWAWAWAEVRKRFPNATYEIFRNEQNLPYYYDPQSGIIVYTSVTINDETHMMWLPVMDSGNNAMKFEPYEIPTKYGPKQIAAATMFDVNKAIMRCLAKNLAMFGLGLYIYSGEDLPEESDEIKASKAKEAEELAGVIKDIEKECNRITKSMNQDEKKEFAESVILKTIGQLNYKTHKNIDNLRELLSKVQKIKAKSAA